jgi:transposase InsO family protein
MEAGTVARIIVEQVITRSTALYVIHSDQRTQYDSQLFTDMCKLLGIKKTIITPYNSKLNGMVERFNKILVSMLCAFVDDHNRHWDTYLPLLMVAHCSAKHDTTG